MSVCVTGATGFVGGHVARLQRERGEAVRVTYPDRSRLDRIRELDLEPVRADVLDRGALGRALRDCRLVFDTAGYVGARPVERVWEVSALSTAARRRVGGRRRRPPRGHHIQRGWRRAGPPGAHRPRGRRLPWRRARPQLRGRQARGRSRGLGGRRPAGRRGGDRQPVLPLRPSGRPLGVGRDVNPAIGNYLLGRLPAVVDAAVNVMDVRDVAAGHLAAAEHGRPGERYILGGHDIGWAELIDRVARISGVHHPIAVLPRETARAARMAEALHLPLLITSEALVLMAQNWRYSSTKARRELGYRVRRLDATLRDTVRWYQELIHSGALRGGRCSPLSLAAFGLRLADRAGALTTVRAAERYLGRRLVIGA